MDATSSSLQAAPVQLHSTQTELSDDALQAVVHAKSTLLAQLQELHLAEQRLKQNTAASQSSGQTASVGHINGGGTTMTSQDPGLSAMDQSNLNHSLAALAEVQRREQLRHQQEQEQAAQELLRFMQAQQQANASNSSTTQEVLFDKAATNNTLNEADLLLRQLAGGRMAQSGLRMHSAPQQNFQGLDSLSWQANTPNAPSISPPQQTTSPLGGLNQAALMQLQLQQHMAGLQNKNSNNTQVPTSPHTTPNMQLQGFNASHVADLNNLAHLQAARGSLQGTAGNPVVRLPTTPVQPGKMALQQWLAEKKLLSMHQQQHVPNNLSMHQQQQALLMQQQQLQQQQLQQQQQFNGLNGLNGLSNAAQFMAAAQGLNVNNSQAQQWAALQNLRDQATVQQSVRHLSLGQLPAQLYVQASASEGGLPLQNQHMMPFIRQSNGLLMRPNVLMAGNGSSGGGSKRSGASRRRKAKMYQALNQMVQAVVEEGIDRDVAEAAATAAAATLKGGVPNLPGGSAACASVVQAVFQQRLQQQLVLRKLQASHAATNGMAHNLNGVAGLTSPDQLSTSAPAAQSMLFSPTHANNGAGVDVNAGANVATSQWAQLLEQLLGATSSLTDARDSTDPRDSHDADASDGDDGVDAEDLVLLKHLNLGDGNTKPARGSPLIRSSQPGRDNLFSPDHRNGNTAATSPLTTVDHDGSTAALTPTTGPATSPFSETSPLNEGRCSNSGRASASQWAHLTNLAPLTPGANTWAARSPVQELGHGAAGSFMHAANMNAARLYSEAGFSNGGSSSSAGRQGLSHGSTGDN